MGYLCANQVSGCQRTRSAWQQCTTWVKARCCTCLDCSPLAAPHCRRGSHVAPPCTGSLARLQPILLRSSACMPICHQSQYKSRTVTCLIHIAHVGITHWWQRQLPYKNAGTQKNLRCTAVQSRRVLQGPDLMHQAAMSLHGEQQGW